MVILGSTGSIGTNALLIAKRFGLHVEALCANSNTKLLNQQIAEFNPNFVAIGDESLKDRVNHKRLFCGENGILDMLDECKSDTVVNALVGFAGLKPSVKAINLGKKLALANKESLVVGGKFLNTSQITPIDSEHFGLKYLLGDKKVEKMIITASGGAFRNTPLSQLPHMSVEDALKHPNWSMGKKITIDSATMVNKLFELLEAKWLFNAKRYDALIEERSLIHALIEFCDGSTTAHFANADMKLPIAYALCDEINEAILPHVDLAKVGEFNFKPIDKNRYPIWEIKDEVLNRPELGVIINAANEIAIEKFIEAKINVLQLVELIKKAIYAFSEALPSSLQEVYEIDLHVREFCKKG